MLVVRAREKIEDRGSKIANFHPLPSIFHPRPLALLALLLVLIQAPLSSALDVPPLKGRVNDYAGLMSASRAQALDQRLAQFENQTGHQIAVLTIPSLQGDALESFSIRVAETWKIGKGKFDNGVILLIAQNDRKLRIEVGYGLEGVLPDAIASRIIREVIVPRFRDNDFAGGVEAGVEAIMKVTSGEALPAAARKPKTFPPLFANLLGLLLMAALYVLSAVRWHGNSGVWGSQGRRRNYGWWMGGGFGDGGFGGGGGGFSGGGGGFGGGGASGSW